MFTLHFKVLSTKLLLIFFKANSIYYRNNIYVNWHDKNFIKLIISISINEELFFA